MQGSGSSWVLGLVAAVACGCAGDRPARDAGDARGAEEDGDAVDPRTADGSGDGSSAAGAQAPESRPRLRHTVTLGESLGGGPGDDDAPSPAPPGAPPVVVIVEPSPPVWGYYGAPGWVSGPGWDAWWPQPGWHGRVPADPVRRPTSPRPWSPPPEYGPRFPFKTAPADPWR